MREDGTGEILDWARRFGVRATLLGLGGCAVESVPALDPQHDLDRFGPEALRSAPRRGDLLVVAGPVNGKMAPLVRRLWDEMPAPKWSLALGDCAGDCAAGGGPWRTYAVLGGLDRVIPVDVRVPGDPPSPEALAEGLRQLQAKIEARIEARTGGGRS
jgi:NADH-quinone oxidoreductase subunit B